jgi:phage tail protein X
LEATLDSNPHLAKIHRETPFLPVGTQVRIPIDPDVFAGRPQPVVTSTIAGNIV